MCLTLALTCGCGTAAPAVSAPESAKPVQKNLPATARAPQETRGPTPPATAAAPTTAATGAAPTQAGVGSLTALSHVYLIVMENKEYGDVIGSPNAPYINRLADEYGLASNYTAVAHPSEPNYIALFAGSTLGVADDAVHALPAKNLVDQIEGTGKTWKVFAQNVPPGCFTGESSSGGADGEGTYARKHDPAISFSDISSAPARCANIADFAQFDPGAANFELIVPNLCNDMHDCSVSAGDDFLKQFAPRILNSAAWQQGGVLFLVWDEGTTNLGGGGHVPLLVVSKQVPAGFKTSTAYNHYSLVRTIEDAWGLGCLNLTCSATELAGFFARP
ncbi:MAG: alkaline phosphatase family protein [Chloroflexi bacterium]|nr:alkaline phosphatase family protein [Chloroflexota bacterium]